LLAFELQPPAEIVALFYELDKLPESSERQFVSHDVCLGFCYDPIAALGFDVLPHRMRLLQANRSMIY
jgi:hypothetical protein